MTQLKLILSARQEDERGLDNFENFRAMKNSFVCFSIKYLFVLLLFGLTSCRSEPAIDSFPETSMTSEEVPIDGKA